MNTSGSSLIRIMMERLGDEECDKILTEFVEQSMTDKLEISRGKGRYGWYSRACNNAQLLNLLHEHYEKVVEGDLTQLIDVINLSGMIMVRSKMYGDEA